MSGGEIGRTEKYNITGFPATRTRSTSSTVPDSAAPVTVPNLVQNNPTSASQPSTNCLLMTAWARSPSCGTDSVSQRTGCKTTPKSVECVLFHSLTTSHAISRSIVMSLGEAINIRTARAFGGAGTTTESPALLSIVA